MAKLAVEFMPRQRYEDMYFHTLDTAAKDYILRRKNQMKSVTLRLTLPESIPTPGVQDISNPVDAAVHTTVLSVDDLKLNVQLLQQPTSLTEPLSCSKDKLDVGRNTPQQLAYETRILCSL